MHTRPVGADELNPFVEAASAPDHRRDVEHYLESMFTAGSMHPEWCFVAEEEQGDSPLGRVAFWTLPGMEKPFALVLLALPWDGEYMGVGTRLLEDVLDKARALGAEEIEHVVDDPPMRPQFQDHPERRIELLEGVGFTLRRESRRFEWAGGQPPAVPRRLSFRMLEEVGEDAFVEAMRIVSEGTLDREIRGERERIGAQGAARVLRGRAKGRARSRLVATRLCAGRGAHWPGDAGRAARLPYRLLRRRGPRDEGTGVRRRPARLRHRDAT